MRSHGRDMKELLNPSSGNHPSLLDKHYAKWW